MVTHIDHPPRSGPRRCYTINIPSCFPSDEHEDAEAGAEEKSGVAPEEGQQDVAQLHGGCIQGRRGLIQRQRGGFRVGEGGFSDRGVDSGAERSGRKRH